MTVHEERWQVLADADSVARVTVDHILDLARKAIANRGRFRLSLAGGRTPEVIYQLLAEADADWSCWEVFHGDERCLPVDHPDRNSDMVRRHWLSKVGIPEEQIFDIPAEQGAEQAAAEYAQRIADHLPLDFSLLGLGEDGHTASLFPGHLHNKDELVHAVHNAPKPPEDRVSLSMRTLCQSREVLIIATGEGKAEVVKRWRDGEALPVTALAACCGADVLLDRTAAGVRYVPLVDPALS